VRIAYANTNADTECNTYCNLNTDAQAYSYTQPRRLRILGRLRRRLTD